MAKFIDQSDLDNKELKQLPIRRGCIGWCACLGLCRDIVGHIDREKYEYFIKEYQTVDEFLTNYCNNTFTKF